MKKEAENKGESAGKTILSVIFLILNIMLGIVIAFLAIYSFLTGTYLIGFLFFALAIFIFLPRRITKISNWLKFIIAIAGFILILALTIALYWPGEMQYLNHNLKEEFAINEGNINISMIVYNTTTQDSITVGGQKKTTTGYFLVVYCAITNLGESAITLNPTPQIKDNQNKTYSGIGFSGAQDNFQPNLKKQVYFVFELPNSAKGLIFRIADSKTMNQIKLGI